MLPDARTNMSRARGQYADNGPGSVSSQENSETGHTEGVTRVSQLCRSASLLCDVDRKMGCPAVHQS